MRRISKIGIFAAGALLAAAAPSRADTVFPVRVALVTDTHTTRGTSGEQPLYKGRLDKTIEQVNGAHVDLALISGDLTDGGKPEQYADFKAQAAGFQAPAYWIPGNHDVGNKHVPGKPGGVSDRRVVAFETALGPSYWAIEKAGLRVIGIDSAVLGSGLQTEADQWAFLEKELARPSPLPTLLVTHYPPFIVNPDEPGGYWNIEPEPRARLLQLAKTGGVCAILSGHLHRPLRNSWNGIPIITSLPVSFGLPAGKQPVGWTLITVYSNGLVTAETRTIGPS